MKLGPEKSMPFLLSLLFRTWKCDTSSVRHTDTRLKCSTIINPGLPPAQVQRERAECQPVCQTVSIPHLRVRHGSRFDTLRFAQPRGVSAQLHSSKPHLHHPLLDLHRGHFQAPIFLTSFCVKGKGMCYRASMKDVEKSGQNIDALSIETWSINNNSNLGRFII